MAFNITPEVWKQLRQQSRVWRNGALPGLAIISCVVLARFAGTLQTLEWMAFDTFLRWRPLEAPDTRIVIVGIHESDIRAVGKYPIPDAELARLITVIKRHQPRVIGLDIFRDVATDSNRLELFQVFRQTPNLVGIQAGLGDASSQVEPPPELPPDRVGLADTLPDPDGKLRRSLIASKLDSGAVQYGLALRLADIYLRSHNMQLKPVQKANQPIQLGRLTLPRFRANTGGYVRENAGGNQILINFRSHPSPFTIVSMTDVLNDRVAPEQLRDRIVLIGITASKSSNDTFITSATKGTLISNTLNQSTTNQYQLLYGVEHIAHVTSQIISAALDGRSLLRSWYDGWEYLWIITWGLVGITLGLWLQSPWKTLVSIGIGSIVLTSICYGFMILSYWVPLVPVLLALWGAGLTSAFFDQRTRLLLEQREQVLKRTYDVVHNGPLQTLAAMLRSLGDEPLEADRLRSQLHLLNQELRSVYESMSQAIQREDPVSTIPVPELLYQVYETTIRRELPGFNTIQLFIPPDFSILETCPLTTDQKQGLSLFLQEALCNVGKHAVNANRLDVVCFLEKQTYCLQIIDNGSGNHHDSVCNGRGTEQAKELARSLHGKFQRRPHEPQGTVCELTWAIPKRWMLLEKLGKFTQMGEKFVGQTDSNN